MLNSIYFVPIYSKSNKIKDYLCEIKFLILMEFWKAYMN